jgi:arsenate reductase
MEFNHVAEICAALAQESRLAVIRLLVGAGRDGLPAGEIASQLGLAASTASFHLSGLERAGLLHATRQGRQIRYAARIAPLQDLLGFLAETCGGGAPDPAAPVAPPVPATQAMIPGFNVLFLCTRNSARSILAEALLHRLGGARFRAYSAGSAPAAAPLPEVLDLLRRLGHDVAGLHSKSWDVFSGPDAARMDFVIALCDIAAHEPCPDFAQTAVTAHWPLPDPAGFAGSATEQSLLLGELYAGLRRRLDSFVNLPFAALDRLALKARLDRLGGGALAGAAVR